jgi:hypothetical protein
MKTPSIKWKRRLASVVIGFLAMSIFAAAISAQPMGALAWTEPMVPGNSFSSFVIRATNRLADNPSNWPVLTNVSVGNCIDGFDPNGDPTFIFPISLVLPARFFTCQASNAGVLSALGVSMVVTNPVYGNTANDLQPVKLAMPSGGTPLPPSLP